MTVYREEPPKSWSLALFQDYDDVILEAVDTITGKGVATLMRFYQDGVVEAMPFAKNLFEEKGYPSGDLSFDDEGRICVRRGKAP